MANMEETSVVLQRKLESKSQALLILSQELEHMKIECSKYQQLNHTLNNNSSSSSNGISNSNDMFMEERQQLLEERENLRRALKDRQSEIEALRQKVAVLSSNSNNFNNRRLSRRRSRGSNESKSLKENYVTLIRHLEQMEERKRALSVELRTALDERMDLEQECVGYKRKCARLNGALNALLKSDAKKHVDLDNLLEEHNFLSQRLKQVEEELELANTMGKRYKVALEKSGGIKNDHSEEDKKTKEDLLALMNQTSFACPLKLDLGCCESLRQLSLALLESLLDRMTQLKHQRSANRHLARRLNELEARIESSKGAILVKPTLVLAQGAQLALKEFEDLAVNEQSKLRKESGDKMGN